MKIKWRPYQIACKHAIKNAYDKGVNKQLIVSATGTGKRMMSVDLMRHFPRALFLAHREELIVQAYDEINSLWPMHAGIVKGPVFEIDKRIVVASVQTLYNRLDKINPDTFPLIIVDEAHHYVSPTYLKTIRHFNPKLLTAWTATPKRLDGLSLSNIVQDKIFEYNIENGIDDGFLAPVEAYQIRTPIDISTVKRTAGDFNQKQLSEKVDSDVRNKLIVKKYEEYTHGRQGVAYCVDINHCYNLKRFFIDRGIHAEVVVSDTERCPNRSELVADFQKGKIDVLINVNILTEGFDYNDVGVVMMARPTQSETLYIQSIGRGTRLKSESYKQRFNTDKCIILDFVDNTGKLTLINSWELEKDKPIEDRKFLPEEHRQKLLEEREKRERRLQVIHGRDRKINLLKLPEVTVWNSPKMADPATEKQIQWLKAMNVWQEDVEYTKAMASELISNQPAKEWQIRYLGQHKYDVSSRVTIGQYQKVKWLMDNRSKYAMEDKLKNSIQNGQQKI